MVGEGYEALKVIVCDLKPLIAAVFHGGSNLGRRESKAAKAVLDADFPETGDAVVNVFARREQQLPGIFG
jgi:hypothetical protein